MIKRNLKKEDYLFLFVVFCNVLLASYCFLIVMNYLLRNEIVFNLYNTIPIELFLVILMYDLLTLGIIQIIIFKKIMNLKYSYGELFYQYLLYSILTVPFFLIVFELIVNAVIIETNLKHLRPNEHISIYVSILAVISIFLIWKLLFNMTLKNSFEIKQMGFIKFMFINIISFSLAKELEKIFLNRHALNNTIQYYYNDFFQEIKSLVECVN